jgi:putative drug exporter of the RND superfamily
VATTPPASGIVGAAARTAVRHHRVVLALTLLFVVVAVVFGTGVVTRLSGGGFADPGAASTRAAHALDVDFHSGEPNFVLLVSAAHGVDAPDAASAGTALSARVSALPHVQTAVSYWTAGRAAALRSGDGKQALILVRLSGTDDQTTRLGRSLGHELSGRDGPLTVRAGGQSVVFAAVGDRIQSDLSRAELIVFPVTFVLLVLVFGGITAALLPLAVGGVSIVGTLLVLRIITSFTDVSVYALNLTTGLGLGLAIDYSLFVVTRYREELAKGTSYDEAIVASVRTAGRTVVFSAVTVALSLAGLLVFPLFFLRSFGYAGIAVVVIAALGAVFVLPALLAILGPRIDSLTLFRRRPADATHGFWQRTALAVMRRPIVAGSVVVALLVVLGLPFLGVRFGLPDDRVLPRGNATQQVQQALRTDFSGRSGQPVSVVGLGAHPGGAAIASYARRLSTLPGADVVQSSAGTFSRGREVAPAGFADTRFSGPAGFWLQVTPSVEPYSDAGKRLVRDVRATASPAPVLVGGMAAQLVDTEHSLAERLPIAAGIIVAAMIVVLFLFTGSVVVPLKTLVLNLLSLSATFGAMVWIFQEGHLAGLVGHPIVTGTLDTTTPILMFCVAFGLSMDYEVFLLSRIKETYDVTRDNTTAVSVGLERTGRLVTAAAALIAVVWIAFVSSGVTFIKMLGLGMAIAVIVDATLVRGVLVPAFMRLAGDWNWWAPRPLRRLHDRFGFAHEPPGSAADLWPRESVRAGEQV